MRRLLLSICISLISFVAYADAVLIENVRIFNGIDEELTRGNVLVIDDLIATISRER